MTPTNLRSYFFDLLILINGTKHFKEHPGSLVSFAELGSAKEVQCKLENFNVTSMKLHNMHVNTCLSDPHDQEL